LNLIIERMYISDMGDKLLFAPLIELAKRLDHDTLFLQYVSVNVRDCLSTVQIYHDNIIFTGLWKLE